MKKLTVMIIAVMMAVLFINPDDSNAGTRVYIKVGPPKAKVVKVYRPHKPFKNSIWVSGHYTYQHGKYAWVEGHWVKGRAGYRYVQPHWKNTPRGHYFVAGFWIKK